MVFERINSPTSHERMLQQVASVFLYNELYSMSNEEWKATSQKLNLIATRKVS